MKCGPSREVEVPGESADPAEDLKGGYVEVGPFPSPGGNDLVNFILVAFVSGNVIAHESIVRQES